MKIKTSELTGGALDWVVLKCESGTEPKHDTIASWWAKIDGKDRTTAHGWSQAFNPSTNWAHGGPIINRERISRTIDHSGLWVAYWTDGYGEGDEAKKWIHCDRSELVAGLRCLVASKLGPEVEIPAELS